jgi:hypothetical protein
MKMYSIRLLNSSKNRTYSDSSRQLNRSMESIVVRMLVDSSMELSTLIIL